MPLVSRDGKNCSWCGSTDINHEFGRLMPQTFHGRYIFCNHCLEQSIGELMSSDKFDRRMEYPGLISLLDKVWDKLPESKQSGMCLPYYKHGASIVIDRVGDKYKLLKGTGCGYAISGASKSITGFNRKKTPTKKPKRKPVKCSCKKK